MNINITGRNVELTDALRQFTTEKFNKIIEHFPMITSINVVFGIEKVMQIAEATLHIPNHQIHAKSESEDLYAAIDLLVDKVNKQIIKHKEKDASY